jgi:hypothetical protein
MCLAVVAAALSYLKGMYVHMVRDGFKARFALAT